MTGVQTCALPIWWRHHQLERGRRRGRRDRRRQPQGRLRHPRHLRGRRLWRGGISLKLVLPVARELMGENAQAVCLIKPQFEAGRENVGKKVVVRDPAVHIQVINQVVAFVKEMGFSILGLTFSPVKGPEGNIEYLLYIQKGLANGPTELSVEELVQQSHLQLDRH